MKYCSSLKKQVFSAFLKPNIESFTPQLIMRVYIGILNTLKK